MKKVRFDDAQEVSFGLHLLMRPLMSICWASLLAAGLLCISSTPSFAQAPGWSRGQQILAITYDECTRRAPQALQAEGYRIDYASGAFAVGIKAVHTAVGMCNGAPDGKTWVNIVVASNGNGGGSERQRLQARMEPSGTQQSGCRGFNGVWDINDGRLTLEVRGNRVNGSYRTSDTITGTVNGNVLEGEWHQSRTGRVRFELHPDGSFSGRWSEADGTGGAPWTGKCAQ